ncbi:MAG TPA: hypothetical protein VIH91_05260 [Terriglobales bacterium]
MLIPAILAFALMFPDFDPPPKFKVRVENNEVWMETSAGCGVWPSKPALAIQ